MKIGVICSHFENSSINKLPWKYIYEIAKYLENEGHEIIIITDTDESLQDFNTISLKKLFLPFKGETKELLAILNSGNLDKCIMLLGLTSLLRIEFDIKIPVIGIFTSPLYSLNELLDNVGFKDSIKYYKYMTIHYVNSIIPNIFVKRWVNKFESIVFLSKYTEKKLLKKGLNDQKAKFIPVGFDNHFLDNLDMGTISNLRNDLSPEKVPIIMYFTSPLTLRGTDTLVRALGLIREKCKLIILSRLDTEELKKEESYLNEIAKKINVFESVEIISKYLSPDDVKYYLAAADIICLPFKIVISDVPVSVLEAMAMEKPIISCNIACIPELLKTRGILIHPNNKNELAKALSRLLIDEELIKNITNNGRKYILSYPTWTDVGQNFEKVLKGNK